MRWVLFLFIIPLGQACVMSNYDFDELSVSDRIALTNGPDSLLQIDLQSGEETSFDLSPLRIPIAHSATRFLTIDHECTHDPQVILHGESGSEIGTYEIDSGVFPWDGGFAALTNWDWNGNWLEFGPVLQANDWWQAVSRDGHSVYLDNGTLLFSTGARIEIDENSAALALAPGGKTVAGVSWQPDSFVWSRGEHAWNWPAPEILQLAITETHIGSPGGHRYNLQTGTIDRLAVPALAVAADDELYWTLASGAIVSESKLWDRGEGEWTPSTHPGWTYVGQGTNATPASVSEVELTAFPALGLLLSQLIIARYVHRRSS